MNWGNKLLFAFMVFATALIFLVYRSVSTNYELVEKDYYNQELRYQQIIDGTKEANNLATGITLTQNEHGILLQLPPEMKNKPLSGDVWFYCAYNEKKDKKFILQPDKSASQFFSAKLVSPGNYTVKINWKDEQRNYYSEKALTVL